MKEKIQAHRKNESENLMKTKSKWGLNPPVIHFLISLIITMILALVYPFTFAYRIPGAPYSASELILTLLYAIPWSLLAIPVIVSAVASYPILNKNISLGRKVAYTLLMYLAGGLIIPLFLIIGGVVGAQEDQEAIWAAIIGLNLLIPYTALVIVNYTFMCIYNTDKFRKK
ncbi:hypothetical protein J4419_00745 [Candidatus Woesearchaeota archaeon]|nr:hypothetical protein [Candidatus Woesearchaeota archaeon]HLC44247.1 hypothetical protein [Patescibacteria group bacterium]